jgi:tight adherence protein C
VLQDEQIKSAQLRLMQAGIRNREFAVIVIFSRLVLPILFGGAAVIYVYVMNSFPDWTPIKRSGTVAAALIWATRRRIFICPTPSRSAPTRSARACPTRSTCW